jgi:hypothetical protein
MRGKLRDLDVHEILLLRPLDEGIVWGGNGRGHGHRVGAPNAIRGRRGIGECL